MVMSLTKIGYARCSTSGQSLDIQLDKLKLAGCEKIFTDKVSGKSTNRKGLQDMLSYSRELDEIFCTKLDRLGRNTRDMISIIEELNSNNVHVTFIDDGISTVGTMGRMTITILAAVAQAERERILERTNEGREAAVKRGVKMGRKQQITDTQKQEIVFMFREGGLTKSELARINGVSRTKLYQILEEYEGKPLPLLE
mgnify:CR=1 FL=1|tara:strand:+ start:5998 stop:6591 length:594 start_codon:yes stop_codon:yes gene_type:complete